MLKFKYGDEVIIKYTDFFDGVFGKIIDVRILPLTNVVNYTIKLPCGKQIILLENQLELL